MKPENIVLSLERFYLDLIGVILPAHWESMWEAPQVGVKKNLR
jgi:hypothetical protein